MKKDYTIIERLENKLAENVKREHDTILLFIVTAEYLSRGENISLSDVEALFDEDDCFLESISHHFSLYINEEIELDELKENICDYLSSTEVKIGLDEYTLYGTYKKKIGETIDENIQIINEFKTVA